MDFPLVVIVMTVYFPRGKDGIKRRVVDRMTLRSWKKFLVYNGTIEIIAVNDGYAVENEEDREIFSKFAEDATSIWGDAISFCHHERNGVGGSLNMGFDLVFQHFSPIALYAVDDWALTQPFDITPWVQLLVEREDVGMVRLGPPHPGTTGWIGAYTDNWQGWAMRLDRQGFSFGHRPALYHKRMIDSYGWFKEDCSALECEKDYVERFCQMRGPDIVLALPHPWQHIDSVELAYLDPKGE